LELGSTDVSIPHLHGHSPEERLTGLKSYRNVEQADGEDGGRDQTQFIVG